MRNLLVLLLVVAAVPAGGQTPPSAAASGPVGAPSERNADYQLGAQDTLKVTVFDEPTLTGSFRIDADGSFAYPLLERVKAAGRTTADVRT